MANQLKLCKGQLHQAQLVTIVNQQTTQMLVFIVNNVPTQWSSEAWMYSGGF